MVPALNIKLAGWVRSTAGSAWLIDMGVKYGGGGRKGLKRHHH